jgi:hypothetical protein
MFPQIIAPVRLKEPDRGGLGLAQEGVEICEHLGGVPLLEADEFAGDLAVTVDNVGFRDHGGAVGNGDWGFLVSGGGIAIGGERDALVEKELLVGCVVFVGRYAHDHRVPRSNVLLKPVEGGCFLDARRAPGGPEIEDDNLAAEIGEVSGLAGKLQGKIAGGCPGDGRLALPIAGQGKNQNNAGH